MRNLNLPETQCGCESGEHFKCYCSELKENTPSKLKKRLSSCKNFIRSRSKKSYGNVIDVDDEGNLLRSQSMTSTYNIKKDLKELLHITSKKVLEPCVDLEDSQNSSSSGGSKSASSSSLQSSHESIASKQRSPNGSINGSIKSKRSSKSSSKTPPPPLEPKHRYSSSSRRDSNESIDARFEIVLPS